MSGLRGAPQAEVGVEGLRGLAFLLPLPLCCRKVAGDCSGRRSET